MTWTSKCRNWSGAAVVKVPDIIINGIRSRNRTGVGENREVAITIIRGGKIHKGFRVNYNSIG